MARHTETQTIVLTGDEIAAILRTALKAPNHAEVICQDVTYPSDIPDIKIEWSTSSDAALATQPQDPQR